MQRKRERSIYRQRKTKVEEERGEDKMIRKEKADRTVPTSS